jgi:hypothetical protein
MPLETFHVHEREHLASVVMVWDRLSEKCFDSLVVDVLDFARFHRPWDDCPILYLVVG